MPGRHVGEEGRGEGGRMVGVPQWRQWPGRRVAGGQQAVNRQHDVTLTLVQACSQVLVLLVREDALQQPQMVGARARTHTHTAVSFTLSLAAAFRAPPFACQSL